MPRKKETRGRKAVYTPREREKRIKEQQNKWKREHYKAVVLRFNLETDQAVIEKLETVLNKTDYVRSLIQKDIEEKGEK